MKIIYIAGKYTGKTHSEIEDNIRKAEFASIALWRKGWAVITPHLNTAHFERYEDENLTYHTWIEGDIEILERCDAIFMLDKWEESKGSTEEHNLAIDNMPIYYQADGYPHA